MTNYQNRQEERDGQTIKGSYSVVDPDGYVRTVRKHNAYFLNNISSPYNFLPKSWTVASLIHLFQVTYTADPKNGFQAKVTREPTDVKIKVCEFTNLNTA